MEFDELSRKVIGCALEVHRNLGPSLLESTYRQCLACEPSHAGIPFQMELPLPARYKRNAARLRVPNRPARKWRPDCGNQVH